MFLSDGTINPPLGVRGGGPGATARQATRGRDGVASETDLCARCDCGRGRRSSADVAAVVATATRSSASRFASPRT